MRMNAPLREIYLACVVFDLLLHRDRERLKRETKERDKRDTGKKSMPKFFFSFMLTSVLACVGRGLVAAAGDCRHPACARAGRQRDQGLAAAQRG